MGGVSLFWLFIVLGDFFYDGGFAVIGPYSAEVWPTRLRTTGMGSAYGFGGIGKIIGPLGLALIVGSSNVVKPDVTVAAIPASFLFLAAWLVVCGLGFALFGFETRQRSIAALDEGYAEAAVPVERCASRREYDGNGCARPARTPTSSPASARWHRRSPPRRTRSRNAANCRRGCWTSCATAASSACCSRARSAARSCGRCRSRR